MKLIYLLIPTLGLAACASQHPLSSDPSSTTEAAVQDSALPSDLREPSHVHTYIVNDYVDPNNPRLRHRGHLVDVVEQDEKWNLQPTTTDITETNLGPVTAVNDANAAPNPYSAEFETELAQQRDQFRQLADLGAEMTAQMGRLDEMTGKSADAVSENAELRNRLNELQQEIDTLKPASAPVAPDAPKKPSWLDSILDLFRQIPEGTPVAADNPSFRPDAQLRPAVTNAPPPDPLTEPPPAQTNAADDTAIEEAIPSPGEMSQPENASVPQL